MLVNKNCNTNSYVKFVSYTGEYPNLCSGILALEIDGIEYTFGSSWKDHKADFDRFWDSGGSVKAYENWNSNIGHGEWNIDVNKLPEQFCKYAQEIDEVFNNNVQYGCCGGCV